MVLSEIGWWPLLLYKILCLFGWFFLSPLLLCGCGIQPQDLVVDDLTVQGNAAIAGNAAVGGNLEVSGSVSAADDVSVGDDLLVTDDAVIEDDLEVGGDETVVGNETVEGDIEVGGDIVELLEPFPPPPPVSPPPPSPPPSTPPPSPPPPVPEPEPVILTATIYSTDGRAEFAVGEDVRMTVQVVGGKAPYDLRCLWPDAAFTIINDSNGGLFQFKTVGGVVRRLIVVGVVAEFGVESDKDKNKKVVAIPGTGTINCQVTAADGQIASVWYVITVE
ncbi:MAG: hypothetical protein HYT47_02420 [Candidatus Vogelbacteria bacterium]|nr:hypothetical protein [Candidatus Vogelbacteria bacterium]